MGNAPDGMRRAAAISRSSLTRRRADATYRHDADVSVMFAKQRLILSLPGHDAYAYFQARLLKRQNHTAIVLPGVVGPNWI